MLKIDVKNYQHLRELCKCIAFLYAQASEETKQEVKKKFKTIIQ